MVGEDDIYPLNPGFDDYEDYMDYRLFEMRNRRANAQAMRTQGVRDTHFIHNVGKYATPSSNTWEAYSNTVRACSMHFDPEGYCFDKAVAKAAKNRALSDPSARYYADYEPLRHNIAVIRNFVLNNEYGEEVDAREAQDDQKFAHIVQIGHTIGQMLFRGNNPLMSNPFAARISPKDSNVEYDGAVEIYQKLLSAQSFNKLITPLSYIGQIDKKQHVDWAWRLPPIELTPFGKMNYYAPPPTDSRAASDTLMDQAAATSAMQANALREEMAETLAMDAVGTAFAHTATSYNSVENLAQPIKLQAIEIAREILEKLKIQFSGTPIIAMMDYNSGQFQRTIADMNTVITVYKDHLLRACALDPSLPEDPMVLGANEAVGFLGVQIKLRALDRAEMIGDAEHASTMRQELALLPQRWLNPNFMTSSQALGALEQGLSMVVATLAMIQNDGVDQIQRNLMLQASYADPQESSRRLQNLVQDEQIQKLAAERRSSFINQVGHKSGSNQRHVGSPAADGASGKKHGAATAAPTQQAGGKSVFDTLLQNYGANSQQMQSAVNAPTSGNFTPSAPGSAQQVIQTVIAHRHKTGTQGSKRGQRQEQERQEQKQQKQQAIQQKQQNARRAEKAKEALERNDDDDNTPSNLPPSNRPRGTQAR